MASTPRTPVLPVPLRLLPPRLLAGLGAVLLVLAGSVLAAPLAHAADEDPIRRMDISVVADQQRGTMRVTQDFDMEFNGGGDHGPYAYLVTRQGLADDESRWRVLTVNDVEVTSPSGAPADVEVERDSSTWAVRIGDPNTTVDGTQRYVLTYTLDGVVNPNAVGGNGDEIYWNAIGFGWEVPISDVSVTLQGPAAVTATNCYAGRQGSTDQCTSHSADGNTAVFAQDRLAPGEGLTVVGQWPVGTFVDAEPTYTKRYTAANTIAPTPGALGLAAGSLAVFGGLAALLFRRFGRDEAYVGLTPGLKPAPGQETTIGPRREAPVAVRFTPPDDASPSEIGALIDGTAGTNDVVAGIVDLAVRGYLRIDEEEPEGGFMARMSGKDKYTDWRLVKLPADRGALPEHLKVLDAALFKKQDDPTLRGDLESTIQGVLMKSKSVLYKKMVERGWYRQNPQALTALWVVAGLGLIALGVLGGFILGRSIGWGLAGIGPIVVGIGVFIAAFFVSARTAEGSAVLAQAEGFKEYLMTAEADQIKVEEDEHIFSRYLPWAIAFGVESHWVGVFRQIAASERHVAEPYWYHTAAGVSVFSGDNAFFGAKGSFMDAASSSGVWSSSAGASGLSGISSGSAGGGVGGGGGGSW